MIRMGLGLYRHDVLIDGRQHRLLEAPAPDFGPATKRIGPRVVEVKSEGHPTCCTNVCISHASRLGKSSSYRHSTTHAVE